MAPPSIGTSGRVFSSRPTAVPAPPRGGAADGIFIEFDNRRWFSSGPPVPFDSRRFTKIGEFHGFPVYATRKPDAQPSTFRLHGVDAWRPILEAKVGGGEHTSGRDIVAHRHWGIPARFQRMLQLVLRGSGLHLDQVADPDDTSGPDSVRLVFGANPVARPYACSSSHR